MAECLKTYVYISKHSKIRDSLCAICSAEVCGKNFDALTCASCRVFFRRNGCKSLKSFRCSKNGACVIDKYNRRACTFCRLQKCFVAGMSCKTVQELENKYPTERKHFMEVPSEEPTEIVKSKSNPCQTLITEVDHLFINRICDAYKNRTQSFRPIDVLPELFVHSNSVSHFSTLNQFINARLISILRLILFIKTSSPQFQTMDIDDKVVLIKYNIPSLFWINMSLFYNPITNRFCEDEQDNLIFNGKNLLDFYGVDVYNKIIKYLCLLNQFSRVDLVIIYSLILILFFSLFSSCTSLDEPILLDYNHIRQTQNFYILLLVKKFLNSFGEQNTCLLISKFKSKPTSTKKIILVIGGSGAQGAAVIKQLLRPDRLSGEQSPYSIRLLTRDPSHRVFKDGFQSPDIEVIQGNVLDLNSILKALENCYGAFVNTDSFTIGEQAELFAGIRIFELAKQIGTLKHYVYSSLDYNLKKVNYNPVYHVAHYDGKGRVAEWMQQQPSDHNGMVWSIVTTGPYMESLQGGGFVPQILNDGTRVFSAPLGKGHVPIVSVTDIGYFARYIFDHRTETSGKELRIASQMLGWDELVETFKRVTNLPAVYEDVSYDEWVEKFPHKDVPTAKDVPTGRSFRDNFRGWWRLYHDDIIERDMKWIEQVNPERVTVESWMRKTGYDGTPKPLLKDVEDGWLTPSTYEKK